MTAPARVCLMLCGLAISVATPAGARAEEARRVGLFVGNNQGAPGRPPLRYAEQDATELASVLMELGGFRREDVQVLRGRPLAEVRTAIAALKRRLSEGGVVGRRVVVLFYFSGHSDGQALELGADRWEFGDVRRALQELGAEVRIAIVDSCRSGALIAEKGGRPGPTFDIRFTDDLATSGEALLTSSASYEAALESREIGASFFSHHLVSGLRGAADASGDGRVTLGEAYRYAFVNTVFATSNTLSGPQHPSYDYRLTGRGELVLTDVATPRTRLVLPEGFDRILIVDEGRRRVVAELTGLSVPHLALPAGRYLIEGRKQGKLFEVSLALEEGASRELAVTDLAPRRGVDGKAKGGDTDDLLVTEGDPSPRPQFPLAIEAAVGVRHGVASSLPWLADTRLGASFGQRSGWAIGLDAASGSAAGVRESSGWLWLEYFRGLARGPFSLRGGWQISGGAIVQSPDGDPRYWTLAASTGPRVDAAVSLVDSFALGATLGVDGALLKQNGVVDVAVWPTVGLLLRLRL